MPVRFTAVAVASLFLAAGSASAAGNAIDGVSGALQGLSRLTGTVAASGAGSQQISALPNVKIQGDIQIQVRPTNGHALGFDARNPTTAPITITLAYETYDRFGNFIANDQFTIGPIEPMASKSAVFGFQSLEKVAQMKLIRRGGGVWPDGCQFRGTPLSPCPLTISFIGAPFTVLTGG